MTEQYALPPISQQTRDKLQSYGFTNKLYNYLNLRSIYVPRAPGFDAYTYLIMGLSLAGGFFAKTYGKKYGAPMLPFLVAFLGAPLAAFYQKKEADFFYTSTFSKKNPEIELQQYPLLKESYEIVKKQAEAEIQSLSKRVRQLEENVNRQR